MLNTLHAELFRHRENQDGSWDSICMRCYLTAAHSYGEQPLASAELEHHCDETSWLFKEPVPAVARAPRVAPLASAGGTCPPSAMPRFARQPDRIEFSQRRLRAGQPAGLREPVSAEAGSGF
jgi:hypothetical protein